jgi:NhaP-type Na+/H+ or K+/H+ antiporter
MSTIAAFVVLVFLYSLVSRRLEHTVITAPIVFTTTGMLFIFAIPGLHDLAIVLFMGWFGPRGLASIVLGLVFLGKDTHVPGEETIQLAVMATVMLSIFAHGVSALPGITLYTRKVATLDATSPENRP